MTTQPAPTPHVPDAAADVLPRSWQLTRALFSGWSGGWLEWLEAPGRHALLALLPVAFGFFFHPL
jgi:hypothetical protein